MNDKKLFFRADIIELALAAALLVTLNGCVAYMDRPPQGSVYVAPPVVVVEDDCVYYPDYEIYYSNSRHQYAYLENGAWVSRPAPRGVSVNVLLRSPSVKMDFHDSPANHHAAVVQKYPKNWKPPVAKQGQNRKDDQRDQHGDNNER